jgi:low affinity Fe/Cu permease
VEPTALSFDDKPVSERGARMQGIFERFTTGCARFSAQPAMLAFCVALVTVGIAAFLSGNDRFISGANLALSGLTLCLLPILQATQNRGGAALQAKLDELIKTSETARNELIGLENRPQSEIEELRVAEEIEADAVGPDPE